MKKYNLSITAKQAKVIEDALDLYSRIGEGQYDEILSRDFAMVDPKTGDRKQDDSDMINRCRRQLEHVSQIRLGLSPNSFFAIHAHEISDNFRISFDLKQVIRHQLWKDRGCKPKYSVESNVMQFSHAEDLASISNCDDKHYHATAIGPTGPAIVKRDGAHVHEMPSSSVGCETSVAMPTK